MTQDTDSSARRTHLFCTSKPLDWKKVNTHFRTLCSCHCKKNCNCIGEELLVLKHKMGRVQIEDFVAGYLGGAASVIVGHPLDTVKVAGFFKGMSFPLATIAIYNSVVFGVFSNAQRFISQYRDTSRRHPPDLIDVTFASMLAGCVSVGIGGPVDLVKIKLQMQTQCASSEVVSLTQNTSIHHYKKTYKGPVHCVNCILRKEGLLGMYRGAGAMVLRDIPGYCLYFIPYIYLSEWLKLDHHTTPSALSVWLAGGIAGAISWGTATPMDVIKSRLQADSLYNRKYRGVKDCIKQSYSNEGIQVFFRGITVNAIRGFPMSAAMFLTYELSLRALKTSKESN
ncbi:solute carrier family 25 member 48-like isoform X3 [Bufo gargarizans]|uniref:solute carrier family 25 member 48-like isoform X3 n=1 Tax=Bufo gargarizans TaxID=30331 RepID=UPI001CF540F6|nr:solute carrier family 25 member 48-like isoform X3 [Bufo gargarizans]